MEPAIRVEQEAVERGAAPELWEVSWRIENIGDGPLKILAARCPHGKFRCGEKELSPPVDLEPDERGAIKLEVRCSEGPGSEVENAFLILRVQWREKAWLILARLRIVVNHKGVPEALTELITSQPVGFSKKRISP